MLLSIDEKDGRPIYQQLISQIREQVGRGELKAGDELPSVRELADSLGVNMHTVRSAYLRLRDQGIITMRLGRRAKIAAPAMPVLNPDDRPYLISRLRDLVTDARLMGMTADEFRGLVEEELKEY